MAFAALPALGFEQNYAVERATEQGREAVRLLDKSRDERVTIMPSLGNRAIEFSLHGRNFLSTPAQETARIDGIPFLAPWANRLGEQGFWANDRHYGLNSSLKNYQTDNNGLPIHGLLAGSELWQIVKTGADDKGAFVTGRLEFWKHPELMAQWPFAHEYEMTYRLSGGELEVRTSVKNLGVEAMPVVIGFHPYYRLPGSRRDDWSLTTPGWKAVVTDARLIPTGEVKASDLPDPVPMKDHNLDNGFTDLERDGQGRAHFRLESGSEALDVTFGPKYQVAIVWEPPARGSFDPQFVCIEPMASVTDGVNLYHRGMYKQLQSVKPGETWTESFWVRPSAR